MVHAVSSPPSQTGLRARAEILKKFFTILNLEAVGTQAHSSCLRTDTDIACGHVFGKGLTSKTQTGPRIHKNEERKAWGYERHRRMGRERYEAELPTAQRHERTFSRLEHGFVLTWFLAQRRIAVRVLVFCEAPHVCVVGRISAFT